MPPELINPSEIASSYTLFNGCPNIEARSRKKEHFPERLPLPSFPLCFVAVQPPGRRCVGVCSGPEIQSGVGPSSAPPTSGPRSSAAPPTRQPAWASSLPFLHAPPLRPPQVPFLRGRGAGRQRVRRRFRASNFQVRGINPAPTSTQSTVLLRVRLLPSQEVCLLLFAPSVLQRCLLPLPLPASGSDAGEARTSAPCPCAWRKAGTQSLHFNLADYTCRASGDANCVEPLRPPGAALSALHSLPL